MVSWIRYWYQTLNYVPLPLYTKILEVNLFVFAYRLFHEDFSPIDGALNYTFTFTFFVIFLATVNSFIFVNLSLCKLSKSPYIDENNKSQNYYSFTS